MGSVRLTKDRQNRIHHKAMQAFDLANPQPTLSAEITDLIWQGAYGDPIQVACRQFVEDNRSELNDREINVTHVKTDRVDYIFKLDDKNRRVEFHWPTERLLFGGRNAYLHMLHNSRLGGNSDEDNAKIEEAVRDNATQRDQLKDRYNTFYQQTLKLLSECNTLKQLLESWPAAKEFVDPHDIRQMHEKITRKQAARRRIDTSGVDIDSLNQVVLTSKLVA
jgi:hypothetical protein